MAYINPEIEKLKKELFELHKAKTEGTMATLRTNANATPSAYDDDHAPKSAKPQVWQEIDRLQEAAKTLEDVTVRLIAKLACVTPPAPPDETRRVNEAVRVQTRSQIADTLGGVTESLYVTARTLAQLCETLEI